LILILKLCNSKFSFIDQAFIVKFLDGKTSVNYFNKYYGRLDKISAMYNCNVLAIKIRENVFKNIIYDKLPWENALIGFQMRIKRFRNTYNKNFWYHFNNV
jgi:hypothetical protein